MDDMKAFERQVANVASRVVGPPRHVDALAVARAAAEPSTRWYSRVRAPVAFASTAATVALIALLIVSGLLVLQQDVTDEVGVSPSPSPSALPTTAPPDAAGAPTVTRQELYDGLRAAIVEFAPDASERDRFEMEHLFLGATTTPSALIQSEIDDAEAQPEEDWDIEATIEHWDSNSTSTGLTLDEIAVIPFELSHPELEHPVVDAAISGSAVSYPGAGPESIPPSPEQTAGEQSTEVEIAGKTLLRWPDDPRAEELGFKSYSYRYGDTVIGFTAHQTIVEAFVEALPPASEEVP